MISLENQIAYGKNSAEARFLDIRLKWLGGTNPAKDKDFRGDWVQLGVRKVYLWKLKEIETKKSELQTLLDIENKWAKLFLISFVVAVVFSLLSGIAFGSIGVCGAAGSVWQWRKVRIQINELAGLFGEQQLAKELSSPFINSGSNPRFQVTNGQGRQAEPPKGFKPFSGKGNPLGGT